MMEGTLENGGKPEVSEGGNLLFLFPSSSFFFLQSLLFFHLRIKTRRT